VSSRLAKKRIVFKPDMVTKVFGIRSGPNPVVLLKRSEQSDLRDVYRRDHSRPDIPNACKVLDECDDTYEDTIISTWHLLCMGTIVDPGSSNQLSMDYLGSMVDPKMTHEFAWDEYILDLAMKEVSKIQQKKAKPLVLDEGSSKYEFWITGPFAVLGVSFPLIYLFVTFLQFFALCHAMIQLLVTFFLYYIRLSTWTIFSFLLVSTLSTTMSPVYAMSQMRISLSLFQMIWIGRFLTTRLFLEDAR
jgi:hypothetical protein